MKKRIVSTVMAIAMVTAALAACGGGSAAPAPTQAAPAETQAAAPAATEAAAPAATEAAAPAASGEAEYVIKLGHTLNEDTPGHKAFLDFEKDVEEKSGGRIDIEIYPNSALGSERVMFEQCQMGTLEIAYGTSSVLANFDKNLKILDLPFLFSNEADAREAINGELGDAAIKDLENYGLKKFTWMENGIRHVTNSQRAINTPDDLKGLKIRTMENDIHMSSFSHLGASPTPMAFTELFTALQQKTVDGQENPLYLIVSNRLYEPQKYLSLTGHFYTTGIATVNLDFWNSLPEDLQKIMMDSIDMAREKQYGYCDEQTAEALEFLKGAIEVNEITPENHQLFVDATADVYNEVEAEVGSELMDVVRKVVAE